MTTDGADRSFGAPRFDVVLRGYDRRQVDEHLSRLQRVVSRLRGDLDTARGQSVPVGPPVGPPTPPGLRPRPTPRPRPDTPTGREAPDVVGTFTDRMQTILQAAEDEAAEIRAKARSAVRAEEEKLATTRASVRADEEMARVTLANLLRQRDAVLADLTRVRGQLEALLSGPTARIAVPTQGSAAARRDAGAGHPLPGTPATPPADAPPAGPSDAEATVMARPVEQRPVEQPGAARSDAAQAEREPTATASDADAAVAPAAPAVTAAEQTMVMAPATDATSGDAAPSAEIPEEEAPPTGDAPQADAPADAPTVGVDDTVKVGAVGRPAENGGAAKAAEDDRDPTNTDRDAVSNSR